MKARLEVVTGLLAAVLVAGCQNTQHKRDASGESAGESLLAVSDRPVAVPPPADAAEPPAVEPATEPIDDIELITRKAEAHARRVAEEMQRASQASAAALTDPGPAAQWLDAEAFRIGPAAEAAPTKAAPAEAQVQTATAPPSEAAPLGQAASEAGTANTPVSIEEPAAAAPSVVAPPAGRQPTASQPEAGSGLAAELARALREQPRDLSVQLDYQLLQFVQGKQAPDLAAVAALPEEDQEIISAVMDALANFRHTVRSDGNPLLSRKVKPLMDLGERLRARADLEVPTVQLCRRVDGYGVYEPVEGRLVAGQAHQVIVYCEIRNFMSQLNGQSLWETKVTEELVLYTENDGLPILREAPVVVPDVCRNRRSDFFIVRKLSLPATIPVGRYLLKVTVVDQLASRVAEATLPITFVAN